MISSSWKIQLRWFVWVGCLGVVLPVFAEVPDDPLNRYLPNRQASFVEFTHQNDSHRVYLSPAFGVFGTQAAGSDATLGLSYGGTVNVRFALRPAWHLTIGSGYHSIFATRPGVSAGTATQEYVNLNALTGFRLARPSYNAVTTGTAEWWFDLGFDAFLQAGKASNYAAIERPIFFGAGLSGTYTFQSMGIFYGVMGLYNVTPSAGSRLFGARVTVGAGFPI